MSTSDVLRGKGTDHDPFLYAEVGEDRGGAGVTVLSALARLGLDPWAEAKALSHLGTEDAEVRLKAHLAAITDVPSLAQGTGSKAAKLVSLLPKRAPPVFAEEGQTINIGIPRASFFWVLSALIGVVAIARIFYLAQMG